MRVTQLTRIFHEKVGIELTFFTKFQTIGLSRLIGTLQSKYFNFKFEINCKANTSELARLSSRELARQNTFKTSELARIVNELAFLPGRTAKKLERTEK